MKKEMKTCPYCWEKILAMAKKCKYCGEFLDKEDKSIYTKDEVNVKEKQYKRKYWIGFRIYITVIFTIVTWIICAIVKPQNFFQERKMIDVCYEQIKDRLNAPSTAVFSRSEIRQHPIRWPVVYWIVESQNWFGWVRKHEYYCYYWNKDWDWKFWDVVFENNWEDDEIFRMIQSDFNN